MTMTIRLFNSHSRKKEVFKPLNPDKVTIYVCGPTVYGPSHIGNARPAVVFDVLADLLRTSFKQVIYARNITDIDDRIINAAKEEKEDISKITMKYTEQYKYDMKALNVSFPDEEPYATAHIKEMIEFINDLLIKEFAYVSDDHVLFDISSYNSYGMLSRRNPEEMIAGSRVEVQSYKKKPLDFVLWKPSLENEIGWDSPWGFGRPGWHLECSTMIFKLFGKTIDIHGGGEDLTFPHHENEIAQSACRNDGHPLANYWVHNGLVQMDKTKMSKSLGNVLLVKDLVKKVPGEVIRFSLLSTHYRQPLIWNQRLIDQSNTVLNNMYSLLADTKDLNSNEKNIDKEFLESLYDDLNTPKAISILHSLFKRLKKSPKDSSLRALLIGSANLIGILKNDPIEWFESKNKDVDIEMVNNLIEKRQMAREEKDYEKGDIIRDQLLNMGIFIEDTQEGPVWKKISIND